MNPYIYTFIRDDISPEQKIVQLGHATWEAGLRFKNPGKTASLILLHADDEDDLVAAARKLDEKGIEYYMFYEPDNMMGYSAICTRPIVTEQERAIFGKWELYRHTY
jgi:hypothetical protein